MKHYDTVVIGAGPGGYEAALELSRAGVPTLLIEREKAHIGGTCLNEGCIPAKQYLEAAAFALRADFFRDLDIVGESRAPALGKLKRKTTALKDEIRSGVVWMLDRAGVELMYGSARFADAHTIEVGSEAVTFEHCIIATGSRTREVVQLPIDGKRIVTSRELFELEYLPESIAIVGGGPIGCEFASFFAAFGTRVTIIARSGRLLGGEDEDIAKALMRAFRRRGIDVITDARVQKAEIGESDVSLHLDGAAPVVCETVLSATGRIPLTSEISLQKAGVMVDDRGFVKVNRMFRTSQSHIYAVGDCIATEAYAHTATAEGRIAAKNIAGGAFFNTRLSPSATFSEPAVASCGLGEREARAQGRSVEIKKAYFKAVSKAKIMGDDSGFAKLIVCAESGTILGAAIVGIGATEVIHELMIAVEQKMRLEDLKSLIHVHPTLSEIVTYL